MTALALLASALLAGCAGAPQAAAEPPKTDPSASAEATPSAAAAPTETTETTTEPAETTTEAPAAIEIPSVDGTTWSGSDNDGASRTMEFLAGGRFATTENGRRYADPASTWTQTGDRITARITEGSNYTGTIAGDTITGSASNNNGVQWTFELTQQ